MTFHQYKMVKRLTRILSLLCISALFMNVLTLFTIKSINAEDSCGTATISIEPLDSIIEEININEDFHFRIKNNSSVISSDYSRFYDYYVYAKDITTNKEYVKSNGTFTQSKDLSVKFDSLGRKEIRVMYETAAECENKFTNTLPVTVIERKIDSPYITFEANSYKALIGDKIPIKTEVRSLEGGVAMMTVDDKEPAKWKEDINSNTFTKSFTWDTSGTAEGMHTLKLKVFGLIQSDGNRPMTDMKTININLCPAGTSVETCASGTGDSSGNTDDGSGTNVSVPEETDVEFGGSTLKFNLTRGSGIGGLVRFIILLLLTLIGAFAFFSFMVAGIQYITAGGDSGKTDKAKKTMIQATIAILLATFSFAIFSLINSLF